MLVVFCASLPSARLHPVCNNVCVRYMCLWCSAVPYHTLGCTRCAIHVCVPDICLWCSAVPYHTLGCTRCAVHVCVPNMCLWCSAVPYHTLGCTRCAVHVCVPNMYLWCSAVPYHTLGCTLCAIQYAFRTCARCVLQSHTHIYVQRHAVCNIEYAGCLA